MSINETDPIIFDQSDPRDTVRLGMVIQCLQAWRENNPGATREQLVASARRYMIYIKSNPSFLKRVRLGTSLLKRTDLDTSLEPPLNV